MSRMFQIKKQLYHKRVEVWSLEDGRKDETEIEVSFYFDFKCGARFVVSAGDISHCDTNVFKAFIKCFEHESIELARYYWANSGIRSAVLWERS